jgi:hypothetical protein
MAKELVNYEKLYLADCVSCVEKVAQKKLGNYQDFARFGHIG